jgi:transposase-like protein
MEFVAHQAQKGGRCPHSSEESIQRWGRTASGEQRYRCTSCCRSFTGLTGAALNRLRDKGLLLEYAECMRRGLSVRKTVKRLNIHPTRAFKWRHRLMPHWAAYQPTSLPGVAEVDETFFR